MDNTQELVEMLRAGHKVNLILAPNEPVQNAHALFNRLEKDHGLTIGRRPSIADGRISFVIWSLAHVRQPQMAEEY